MADNDRSIELEVEVTGTPEEVWRAIATGPGVTSWYVPHVVEEREGGTATASFGPGPEMQISGRVAAWDPPNRVVFDGGEDVVGLAFEWIVEARDGGTCVVRLVNSGFGSGEDWDAQYDAMEGGWQIFLRNLQLHLQDFGGETATAMLPMASWAGPRDRAWAALTDSLAIFSAPAVGDRVALSPSDGPVMAGTVLSVESSQLAMLVEEPAPGPRSWQSRAPVTVSRSRSGPICMGPKAGSRRLGTSQCGGHGSRIELHPASRHHPVSRASSPSKQPDHPPRCMSRDWVLANMVWRIVTSVPSATSLNVTSTTVCSLWSDTGSAAHE